MSERVGVLFVCLGNICRSPMAHGLFAHLVAARGLAGRFEIDSAGTAAYHAGELPDPRTLAVLGERGIALDHRARGVADEDFARFHWLIAMDHANLRALRGRCPPEHRGKLHLALEPIGGGEVSDPYYGSAQDFERNFAELERALDAWIDQML